MGWLVACSLAWATGGTTPTQSIVWPDRGDVVPTDAVFYVLDLQAGLADPVLALNDGAVAVDVVTWPSATGVQWRVVVPLEPLVSGASYTLSAGYERRTVEVDDTTALEVDAPGAYRRWRGSDCFDGDRLSYRPCEGGVVLVLAQGSDEPVEPSLADLGEAVAVDRVGEWVEVDVDGGWPEGVWIGGFDEAGRFTGWWHDEPTEPSGAGTYLSEAPEGSQPDTSATATLATCEADGPLVAYDERDCTGDPGTGTVVDDDDPDEAGCGCQAALSSWAGWLGLLSRR